MREIGTPKIYRLAYNEFAYKKTKDYCKLEDWFQKKGHFSIAKRKITDKKTAYNEVRLYWLSLSYAVFI